MCPNVPGPGPSGPGVGPGVGPGAGPGPGGENPVFGGVGPQLPQQNCQQVLVIFIK